MKGNKCNIRQLQANFPTKNFDPWSSKGEGLVTKFGCDLIAVPGKNGAMDHFVGNKLATSVFVANGFIESSSYYDDDSGDWVSDLGKLHVLRKGKIVVTGQNGTGAVFPYDDVDKMTKSLKKIVNND